METMIKSVLDGTLSANKAADIHGVPRTTLNDRLSGRVEHGTYPGPKSYLTAEANFAHIGIGNWARKDEA